MTSARCWVLAIAALALIAFLAALGLEHPTRPQPRQEVSR